MSRPTTFSPMYDPSSSVSVCVPSSQTGGDRSESSSHLEVLGATASRCGEVRCESPRRLHVRIYQHRMNKTQGRWERRICTTAYLLIRGLLCVHAVVVAIDYLIGFGVITVPRETADNQRLRAQTRMAADSWGHGQVVSHLARSVVSGVCAAHSGSSSSMNSAQPSSPLLSSRVHALRSSCSEGSIPVSECFKATERRPPNGVATTCART